MSQVLDKRRAVRIAFTVVGVVVGVVVVFAFNIAKRERQFVPATPTEFRATGRPGHYVRRYSRKALLATASSAIIFGLVGAGVGEVIGKDVYPEA